MPPDASARTILVHLASGVGNIVMATPLLVALDEMGLTIDARLDADYPETAALLSGWSVVRAIVRDVDVADYDTVIPAIPPFYWPRFARQYRGRGHVVPRPPDRLFYSDEQAYYFAFARALGCASEPGPIQLPVGASDRYGVTACTVVLAPGCKTGEMSAKRWPLFAELAGQLDDVAIVGTKEDLRQFGGGELQFPPHVRSFVGELTLHATAEVLASAGTVVANDSGLGHVAAAVGTPTVLIFGPTPHTTLGRFPPNVEIVRAGLPCEPCWFSGTRFRRCQRRIDCLHSITVRHVQDAIARAMQTPHAVAGVTA